MKDLKRIRGWFTRFGKPVPVQVDVVVCMTCLEHAKACWCDDV